MAHPQSRPATYQDIIDLPEHLVGEIIAGELYTQPAIRAAPCAHTGAACALPQV